MAKFISRQFPNMTVCNLKFENGVGETDDQETIEYIKERGADFAVYPADAAPEITPNNDPHEEMNKFKKWADDDTAETTWAEEKPKTAKRK